MIISGGVNIYPQEVENLLISHPKVADAAVIGVPHPELGEEVKAVVQPLDPGEATPQFADVMSGKSMDRPAVVVAIDGGVELAVRAERGKLEHVVALARPTRSAEQPRGNFEVGLARQCIPPAFARG